MLFRSPAHFKQALSVEDMLSHVEFVTVHVPLLDNTRHTINAERLQNARQGLMVFNFSRDGIVDNAAVCEAIKAGRVNGYVCEDRKSTRLNSSHRNI